jgi:hypothetical protein
MPREPINLFSASGDAARARAFLLARYPHAVVLGDGDGADDWAAVSIPFPDGKVVRVTHDRGYYAGPGWASQLTGLMGYLGRFPLGDRRDRLMSTVGAFRFALAAQFDPDYGPGDERLTVLADLAAELDGVLFSPSAVRDPRLRVLAAADGGVDPDAEWPAVELTAAAAGPPAPLRVARRAVALTLLSARGVLERELTSPHTHANHARLVEWADELAVDDEVEPWEWDALRTAPGMLDPQVAIDAVWRVEGLAVLAWAVYRADLPRYDRTADLEGTWAAVGLFHDARVRELCWNPMLRPAAELDALRRLMRGYHKRLHDHRSAEPGTLRGFAADALFGGFDPAAFDRLDGELALRGLRLDSAPPDVLATCQSIAVERHRAIEWVCRGPAVYSDAAIEV